MTAPSRLSSLLVRDGLVGVKRMEQAFQRQVIYGGSLDTILLEMNAVAEDRLCEYLSLATGLPLAQRDLTDYFDPRAAQACPVALAEQYHVAPVAFDAQALRVLVTDPVDLAGLEALATTLGLPVQPFVVAEYRFFLTIDRIFGIPAQPRYIALASKAAGSSRLVQAEAKIILSAEVSPTPVPAEAPAPADTPAPAETPAATPVQTTTRTHGPIPVPAPPRPGAATAGGKPSLPSQGPHRSTMTFSSGALAQAIAEQQQRAAAVVESEAAPVAPLASVSSQVYDELEYETQVEDVDVPIDAGPVETAPAADSDAPIVVEMEASAPPIIAPAETAPLIAPAETPATPVPAPFAKASWRGGGALVDPSPISAREASDLLATAEDRDVIFAALVRGARSRTRYAAILIVQGVNAFGRMAIDGYDADASLIAQVTFPLAVVPAFQTAVETRSPYIGPVGTGDDEADQFLAFMGGLVPPSALLLPIVIRDRVVALIYAHRGGEALSINEVAELLPLAGDAALALSRLILRIKSQGYAKVSEAQAVPQAQIEADELPTKRVELTAAAGGQWAKAAAQIETETSGPTPALVMDAEPPSDEAEAPALAEDAPAAGGTDALLNAVEAAEEPAASRAVEELLSRPEELMAALRARYPGRLTIDRYATTGRPARASQHGPLLALVVKLGVRAAPLINEHMSSADREVRYYATLSCGEVRSPLLVPGLVARMFDPDYGVRGAALDALISYPAHELDASLDVVRRSLHADVARARAAAHALGELRDVRAIPDLIEATDRDHTTAEEARQALIKLTKQDFGTKAKKWRAWWDKNSDRARVEWLLDALGHPEDKLRLAASEELKRLTGEYFGYHYDLPKREREEARLRWIKWWDEVGRRRFLREGREERNRPTAVLPTLPRRTP